MASSFVGLPVLVTLSTGSLVYGTIQSVNAVQGSILLREATIEHGGKGGRKQQVGMKGFARDEVVGLEVLGVEKGGAGGGGGGGAGEQHQQQQQVQQQRPLPPQHIPSSSAHHSLPRSNASPSTSSQPTRTFEPVPSIYLDPHSSSAYSSVTSLQPQSPSQPQPPGKNVKHRGGRRHKQQLQQQVFNGGTDTEGEAGNEGDVSAADQGYWEESSVGKGSSRASSARPRQPSSQSQQSFAEDFDFGASLAQFDKQREFAHIRSQDLTDPSSLLVSHNKRRGHDGQTKMLPTESVLTEQELYEQNLEQQQLSGSATTTTVGLGEQEEGETETSEYEEVEEELEVGVELERTHLGGGGGERRGTIRGGERPMPPLNGGGGGKLNGGWATKDGGVKVAEIKLRQWKEVISVADIATGPSPTQRHENASRSLASYLLTSSSSPPKTLCLLCNDTEKALVALATAVHLVHRGVKAVALVLCGSNGGEAFKTELRRFSSAGGRFVQDLTDLDSTYDFIIDAIGSNDIGKTLRSEDLSAVNWANAKTTVGGTRVVAVDVGTGWDHDSGATTVPSPLRPTDIVCLGAVRSGLTTSAPEGATVVLLDVGIAPGLWSRAGVEDWDPAKAFGTSFVVELKRT